MIKKESEADLLERAEAEEKEYNWIKAAKLYESVANSFLGKNMITEAAKTYKKLGNTSEEAAYTVDTANRFTEFHITAIQAYKEAMNLFKKSGNTSEELECKALALKMSGFIANSVEESKKSLIESYELMMKANELYSEQYNQEAIVRTLSYAASILSWSINCTRDHLEANQFYQKVTDLAKKSWILSKKLGNIQFLADSLEVEFSVISQAAGFFMNVRKNETLKRNLWDIFSRYKESLTFFEDGDDLKALSKFYYTAGGCYFFVGFHLITDEYEQSEYFNKALELIEKGLFFSQKIKNKLLIGGSLFWLDFAALLGRKIEYLQKRINEDIQEVISLGKIFAGGGIYAAMYGLMNLLPSMYYSNIAQMSYFTPAQRKFYAFEGIEHANICIKTFSSFNPNDPMFPWSLMSLTFSYATLVSLTPEKAERDKYVQKMLQYANETKKISETYEEGFAKSTGYLCLYRAYKTLADIAESENSRIDMLLKAIDAQEKYIPHTLESLSGNITARIRLGLLYEEFGILSKETNPLVRAKEIFEEIIKDSIERGYIFYAAIAYEYQARVEDRLGNHTASAENYEKAKDLHEESLKNIAFKRLKKRVKQKRDYSFAWSKIERAKAYHKSENHLRAKKSYNEASEILKNIPKYNFESAYNAAWAKLEEAEQLSKQEKQKEAINQYELTIKAFEDAIKILNEASNKAKEQPEKERIEKLEKVANVRINYCTARINLEEAILLGKSGEHSTAAEKFAIAASLFRNVCTKFKLERERKELEAIYYLCHAWESMELAEKYTEPERFDYAANLFAKASKLFTDTKMKLLSIGNSSFCQALELGSKFDESIDIENKKNLYPKVKLMLSKAASSYGKGGFETVADWALATSIYFDATWHLIQADKELDITEKGRLLGIGSNYLKSALELFGKSGYKDKEAEVQDRLNRVEKEESILFSALNTIKEPSISRSTMGIVAPACPIETSQSPRIGEIRQLFEEERRVALEGELKKKYQIIYSDLLKKYPSVQRREFRVGIAQIGISNADDILNEFYEVKTSGLLGLREDKVELVKANVKRMIETANKNRINILLFPEMTVDLNYSDYLEEIADLAKLYEMYIIPGSYHDEETKRNVSMIIGPDGILLEQEKHIPAIIHMEGKRFKEGIDVGISPRKTIVCNTEFGRMAIVICRDFLDMDLRVELKNFEPPIDIILNPAFTPVTADFKAAHFDARRSIYAYCFFANVAEFGDSLIYTPEKERIERTIPAKEEGLIYKDVDIFKLRSERKKWEKEQKKEKPFIQSTR